MNGISELQCGKAGEYLVCADLILSGYVAFPSEQGLPFDVVAEVGSRLIRIQVKTTRQPATRGGRVHLKPTYLFFVARTGKGGRRTYAAGAVDMFALVALDSNEIGYLAAADAKPSMTFRSSLIEGEYLSAARERRNALVMKMRAEGMSYSRIAAAIGATKANVAKISTGLLKGSHGHRYLRDFGFADAVRRLRISRR